MVPIIPDLPAEMWSLVRQIPRGQVASYGDVARQLGDVVASRFVGHAMMHHRHGPRCPCHRLVRTDGALGKFVTGRTADKAQKLKAEGVEVAEERVDLERYRFTHFDVASAPLSHLAEFQYEAAERAEQAPDTTRAIRTCGGVDVSYIPRTDRAIAAFVELRWPSCKLIYWRLLEARVRFPYVTTYLAFRELPILTQLLDAVRGERDLPPVILVDGSGVLHPRRAGIATMLGVAGRVPTIGVTKKHLAGRVAEAARHGIHEVHLEGRARGVALLPGSGTDKPLYVSPGYGIELAEAQRIVRKTLRGRRLPEPIYWADRLSRQATREA